MTRFHTAAFVAALACCVASLHAQLPKPALNTAPMLSTLEAGASHYDEVAQQIWKFAEVG